MEGIPKTADGTSCAAFSSEKVKRGVRRMVTHEELYLFCALIVAIIGLILDIVRNK